MSGSFHKSVEFKVKMIFSRFSIGVKTFRLKLEKWFQVSKDKEAEQAALYFKRQILT